MLKAPISAVLRQPSQTFSQPLSYASRLPPNTDPVVEMQSLVAATPEVTSKLKRSGDSKNIMSRRKPVIATSASLTLETRIAILNLSMPIKSMN